MQMLWNTRSYWASNIDKVFPNHVVFYQYSIAQQDGIPQYIVLYLCSLH